MKHVKYSIDLNRGVEETVSTIDAIHSDLNNLLNGQLNELVIENTTSDTNATDSDTALVLQKTQIRLAENMFQRSRQELREAVDKTEAAIEIVNRGNISENILTATYRLDMALNALHETWMCIENTGLDKIKSNNTEYYVAVFGLFSSFMMMVTHMETIKRHLIESGDSELANRIQNIDLTAFN